jgi:hypothetical protein
MEDYGEAIDDAKDRMQEEDVYSKLDKIETTLKLQLNISTKTSSKIVLQDALLELKEVREYIEERMSCDSCGGGYQ